MSDDLNLLITFLSTDNSMVRVAICIEHGLNDPKWTNWEYFGEPNMENTIHQAMPMHVASFCEHILDVEEIFWISNGR